jgi:hypothetical protein
MPDDSTVWMVHARTGLTGVKGTLHLDGEVLVFHPDTVGRGDTRIGLGGIRRSRRVRGTPILEVYPDSNELPDVIGFYFVAPPKIADPSGTTTPMGAMNPFRRHAGRRAALRTLRLANADKKAEIEGWVRRLRTERGTAS